MKTLAFVNQKGGVAKTTSVVNVGAAMARAGKQVLLVDLDPQGNLSESVGLDNLSEDNVTLYEVLQGADIKKAVWRIEADYPYDVLPTDLRLSDAEITLVDAERRDYLLKDALDVLTDYYDFVLIDCPPSLGILTIMGLTAANKVYIPVQTQYLPLKGVAQLINTIEAVKDNFNPNLRVGGLFCTMYRGYNLDIEAAQSIRDEFGDLVFETCIRLNNKLAEAPSYGKDIFQYSPKSAGAKQYKELTDEILEREG